MASKFTLWDMSLAEFRDAIEARSMPGCGAVAANAAANGLSLVLKGLRLSDSKHAESERARLIARAHALVERLGDYAEEDVAAFKAYLAAQKGSDADSGNDALGAAVERINQVPLVTARACCEGLELVTPALECTKSALHSDARAGAQLLHAGLSMVLLNVDANIEGLDDAREREVLERERHALQSEADRLLNAFMPAGKYSD